MPRIVSSARCLECRRRKRKCDEVKPVCTLCTRTGVPCVYPELARFVRPYNHDGVPYPQIQYRRVVQLDLRRAKKTSAGSYHTLASGRRASSGTRDASSIPQAVPLLGTEHLARKFTSLLGLSIDGKDRRAHWTAFVPSRLGHAAVLDQAVACIVHAWEYTKLNQHGKKETAFQHYGTAIKIISANIKRGKDGVTAELLAAMKLLESFELSIGEGIRGWLPHAQGGIRCFVENGPEFCRGDFEHALFQSHADIHITHISAIGAPNPFDTPEWLEVEPSASRYLNWSQYTPEHCRSIIAALPDLLQQLRYLTENPADFILFDKVTLDVKELITMHWRDEQSTFCPEAEEKTSSPCENNEDASVRHECTDAQQALSCAYEWTCQIAIAGLIEALYNSGISVACMPGLESSREEDQRCAILILDLLGQYRLEGTEMAQAALLPIQMAWGALWRAQKRLTSDIEANHMNLLMGVADEQIARISERLKYQG